MKKLITVLLGLAMALGTVTLSLAGEQDQGTTQGPKVRKGKGKRKGKRHGNRKGKRNRNKGQAPRAAPASGINR